MYHFNEMFFPLEFVTRKIFADQPNYLLNAIVNAVNFFVTIMLVAHMIACTWLFIGDYDNIFNKEDKGSWLSI